MEGYLISYKIGESQEIGDMGPLLYIKKLHGVPSLFSLTLGVRP